MERKIDHLVYAVRNLEEAVELFGTRLGIHPVVGGYHQNFGTKNALIRLDDGIYFEILAIDDNNKEVVKPRWMGVDFLTQNRITRWAITSNELERDGEILEDYKKGLGKLIKGSRRTPDGKLLQWQLVAPLAAPEVELIPFCIDWSHSETHPFQQLPSMDCKLLEMSFSHPQPELISNIFEQLGIDFGIEKRSAATITAKIRGPKGIIEL